MNTTLCRTHELKSGDRRRPETERQGLAPRPSHDSRVAFREFVTHRSDSKIRLRTLRALTALLFEARKEKSCDLSPARSQPAPLEARQPRSKPWRRRLPPLPGLAERRRRAAQATTSAPPTGGAAAAAPTAPPSAVARRLSSGRRQVPRAEGATGPADARPADPSSSMAGRAPPRRFSAHWRAEEAAGVDQQEYLIRGTFLEDDGDEGEEDEEDVPEPNTYWVTEEDLLQSIERDDVRKALKERQERVLGDLNE